MNKDTLPCTVFRLGEETAEQLIRCSEIPLPNEDELFSNLKTYCTFVGYPRSGHSLVGSFFDAHPEACCAHELDALSLISLPGISAQRLFRLILRNTDAMTRTGRQWSGYDYQVHGSKQGVIAPMKVIGDKKGGNSAALIAHKPQVLDLLFEKITLSHRFIHVIRNPFDMVARHSIRMKWDLEKTINFFNILYNGVSLLLQKTGPEKVLSLRHEQLVETPRAILENLALFLDLRADPDWIKSCADKIIEKPGAARDEVSWGSQHINMINHSIKQFPWLAGYEFS